MSDVIELQVAYQQILSDKTLARESGGTADGREVQLRRSHQSWSHGHPGTTWQTERTRNQAVFSVQHLQSHSAGQPQLGRTRRASPGAQVRGWLRPGFAARTIGILLSIERSSRDPFVRIIIIQTSRKIHATCSDPVTRVAHSVLAWPNASPRPVVPAACSQLITVMCLDIELEFRLIPAIVLV